MGVYFFYGNLDRKEYFSIGVGSGAIKRGGIGHGLGARALGLLLLEHEYNLGLAGTWAGQRVIVFGDDSEPGIGDALRDEGRDISSAALLMLFADDKQAVLDAAVGDDLLFLQLAELAIVHGAKSVTAALERRFHADWKARYGRLKKTMAYVVIPPP